MSGVKIKMITVQFDDGTEKQIPPEELSEAALAEMARTGLSADRQEGGANSRFVLLEWKDGWKEVIKVAPDSQEFIRYYVIRRPEESGRLVLKRNSSDYPELVEISRKPKELQRVTII